MTAPVSSVPGVPLPQVAPGPGKAQKGDSPQGDASFASLLAAMAITGQSLPPVLVGEGQIRLLDTSQSAPIQSRPGALVHSDAVLPLAMPSMPAAPAEPPGPEGIQTAPAETAPFHESLAQILDAAVVGTESTLERSVSELAAPEPTVAGLSAPEASRPLPGAAGIVDPAPVAPSAPPAAEQQAANPAMEQPILAGTQPGEQAAGRGSAIPVVVEMVQRLPGGQVAGSPPPTEPGAPAPTLAEGGLTEPVLAASAPADHQGGSLEGDGAAAKQHTFEAEPALQQVESDGLVDSQPPTGHTAERPVEGVNPGTQPSGLERLTGRYQPQQLVDELARAVATADDGEYNLTLKLHPEHLGEVRLQLHLSGRAVHATMEVANPDARQLLENRGDQLRQNLDQVGFTLSGFEVNTGRGRQSPQERREAFAEPQPGSSRRVSQVDGPKAAAISQIRNAGHRGGRLDTMA